MTLTEIIAEMEKDARQPSLVIAAHKKALDALVELTRRIEALEQRNKGKS